MAYTTELPSSAKRLAGPGMKPRGRYGEGAFECSDEWKVPLADFVRFLTIVGGTAEDIGGIAKRVVPLRHYLFPFAIAYDCNWEFIGWDTSANDFWGAKAKVDYRVPAYATEGADAFISRSTSVGQRSMQRSAAMTGLSYASPLLVDTLVINYTLHNLAILPITTLAPFGGYINNATWRGYDAYTVRFIPPASHETVNVAGTKTYEANYGYEHCRIPWNQEYDDAGSLTTLTHPPSTNFTSLFGF